MMSTSPLTLGLILTALLSSACGSGDKSDLSKAQSSPSATTSAAVTATAGNGIACDKAGDLSAKPTTLPPANLPLPTGATPYLSKGPFGKTLLFFAYATGDPTNLDATRDAAAAALVKVGYRIDRKDQEEGSEAEAHLTGPHETAIQVIQLCTNKVRIKYTLTS